MRMRNHFRGRGRIDDPCFQGFHYSSKEIDELPAQSNLSILHFSFYTGVDILEPSQSASQLWLKSLEFVSTIPGFQGLSWAPVDDASPCQQVIVLIQWISPYSWKLFQKSLGFSMMLGYISTVSNRCIQLALPVDISGFACHLELVSFGFPTAVPTSRLDQQEEFKTQWERTISALLKLNAAETGLLTACGEWLQSDYDSEDPFFVGLFFWKSYTHTSSRLLREDNLFNLERLVENTTEVMSAYTSQLNHISSDFVELRPHDTFPDTAKFETNHPLFITPVTPKYNAIESTDSQGKDVHHLGSMIQARRTPPQRIAVGPAGGWYPMGDISQHHLPPQPDSRFDFETEMISFSVQTENERIATSFANLRKALWQLGDFPEIVWGKNQSNEDVKDEVFLFFKPINPKYSKEETEAQLTRLIQRFLDENDVEIQNLSRRKCVGTDLFGRFPRNMDITTFNVPANDWRSFEYAYCNYMHTTRQQHTHHTVVTPCCAVQPVSRVWVPANRAESLQFFGVFSWKRNMEGAREEWYGDFADRARTEYDLLGHIVDWLRTLSASINVQYVVMEREDPWMTAERAEKERLAKEAKQEAERIAVEKFEGKLEKESREQLLNPSPSIFDLPWAKSVKHQPT